jgi:NADPH:quinone reductase-like Zn-dependent oxidoreductase
MTKAAVLHALGEAPSYEGFAEPKPNKDETLVSVRAASLKNSDKMMADGSHYDSLRQLPAVVGLDGVGVLEDGTRVYCAGPRPPYGTMAETVVPRAFCLPVPDAVDDLTAAALPNPAIASWLSLEWKARLEPGETVLILGATGVAGRLAVQLARHLGAGRVVGAGRNAEALEALHGLGADATISLEGSDDELEEAFADQAGDGGYDVVLDYLWGRPTEALVAALTGHDVTAESRRTRLIQIGEMAGPIIKLPAAALRSSGLEVMGSGGGSIPPAAIFETFPRLWELAANGELRIDAVPVPLTDVAEAWQRGDLGGLRLVLIP